MSLTDLTLFQLVVKQAKWKCKAYSQLIFALIVLHLFWILLTVTVGTTSNGFGFNNLTINVQIYSLDSFIMFACLWAFITALLTQTNSYINPDYSVVTNHLSASLANIIVIIIYSFLATIISFLSLYIVAAIKFIQNVEIIMESSQFTLMQFCVVFLIILLLAAIGYFIGSAFHLHKLFGVGIIILIFLIVRSIEGQLLTVFTFYFQEGDGLFLLKALITVIFLFIVSVVLINRKEVVRR